jgi:hypothetical protein
MLSAAIQSTFLHLVHQPAGLRALMSLGLCDTIARTFRYKWIDTVRTPQQRLMLRLHTRRRVTHSRLPLFVVLQGLFNSFMLTPTLTPMIAEEVAERATLQTHAAIIGICSAVMGDSADADVTRYADIVEGAVDMFQR